MPDHPEEQHLAQEDGFLLKKEDGGYLLLDQQEGAGLSRFRQEGEPYSFFLLEDASGDLLLELQPHTNASIS